MPLNILTVIGTRPEAIKMAPLILALSEDNRFKATLCVTGQHDDMLFQVLDLFGINPDHNLRVMTPRQGLSSLSAKILERLDPILISENPDWVIIHGDTTTTSSASLAAFHRHIPVAHVEAGLRSHDMKSPWPEELNRRLTSMIADLHFAPTETARQTLLSEGISPSKIEVTGNTVIDSLLAMKAKLDDDKVFLSGISQDLPTLNKDKRLILVTAHRRENFDTGLSALCEALRTLARREDVEIVLPVHLNPTVQNIIRSALGDVPNIYLIPPVDYAHFVALMTKAHLIISDSGGLQEEAPSLNIPILVTRDTTERPEIIDVGAGQLVGCDTHVIIKEATRLLEDHQHYARMASAQNPYGDGQAVPRIIKRLASRARSQTK